MNKELIFVFLLIIMGHRLIKTSLEEQQSKLALLEQMSALEEDNKNKVQITKDELMDYLVEIQSNDNGGVQGVSGDSNLADAAFGAQRTDLSTYFKNKSQSAINNLPPMTKDNPTCLPEYSPPGAANSYSMTEFKNEKPMNGGMFYDKVAPYTDDCTYQTV